MQWYSTDCTIAAYHTTLHCTDCACTVRTVQSTRHIRRACSIFYSLQACTVRGLTLQILSLLIYIALDPTDPDIHD